MALQSSGQISFSNIINEFGQPSGKNLGAYRISENVGGLSNLGLDNNDDLNATIPQSGTIKFSDFYGKKLNIIVNYYSGGTETLPQNGYQRYQANNVRVLGGFRGRPSRSSNIRAIIHINKTIHSQKGGRNTVAIRTGGWDGSTNLDIINNGGIYGSGGDGGYHGHRARGPGRGSDGTSGLGIEYPAELWNYGTIYGGGGGGGGGNGSSSSSRRRRWWGRRKRRRRRRIGGDGGGGAGIPSGSRSQNRNGGGGGGFGSNGGSGNAGGGSHGFAIVISGSGSGTSIQRTGTQAGGTCNGCGVG